MPPLAILEYPDPRLRLISAPVTEFDADLQRLIDDLFDTLYAEKSIGLSAPQADDHRQVLVMDLSGDGSAPRVYINPEILARAKPGFVEERCLSVPGVTASVWRATQVRVRAQDRHGVPFERELNGMEAVCLQHEMDHFAGMLFVDRLSAIRRFFLRGLGKTAARKTAA